jgi:hypothetical protein
MNLEQLIGRHFRLRQELGIAYSAVPWHAGRIDLLTNELAATEREIAAFQGLHQQADGAPMPASQSLLRGLASGSPAGL